MNYSERQFVKLMEMVEAEGGQHLDEQCKARTFTQKKVGPYLREMKVTLPYCANSALFEIPYSYEAKGTNATVMGTAKVCALDDMMGLWPRYEEAMR